MRQPYGSPNASFPLGDNLVIRYTEDQLEDGWLILLDRDLNEEGYAGLTFCGGGAKNIYLDDQDEDSQGNPIWILTEEQFTGLAAHELGHPLGLPHMGRYDDRRMGATNRRPTMTTCVTFSDWALLDTISGADRAGLLADRSQRELSENPGFDRGNLHGWGASGGLFEHVATGGVDGGQNYARHLGYGERIVNTNRLWDPPGQIAARANYKIADEQTTTGYIKVQLRTRPIDAPSATSGSCEDAEYRDNKDLNVNPLSGAGGFVGRDNFKPTPTEDWEWNDTEHSDDHFAGFGVDAQIRIWNFLQTVGGEDQYMHIDHARIICDFGCGVNP